MSLSILIPMISKRLNNFTTLINKLEVQSNGLPVEILGLFDNKNKTIGEKRNLLVNMSSKEYICFIDDDDDITDDYIKLILTEINKRPDCITFDIIICKPFANSKLCKYDLRYNNEYIKNIFYGKPTHVHIWKKELVKNILFPNKNKNEDIEWAEQAIKQLQKTSNINKTLYQYNLDHRVMK